MAKNGRDSSKKALNSAPLQTLTYLSIRHKIGRVTFISEQIASSLRG
jgi:hypothetical protein